LRLAIVFLGAISLAAAAVADGGGFVECSCPDSPGFDARAYWSPQRISGAKALTIPVLSSDQRKMLMLGQAERDDEDFALPASPSVKGLTSPGDPQRADVTISPHSLVGKLLFTKDGQDSYCTAQLVGDDSMIITAAHCVRDEKGGRFFEKFSFVPGFQDGTNRFAAVRCVGTWSAFPHPRLPNYALDYAFGKLATPLNAHLALKPRLPVDEWISVGYPEDVDGGQRQQFVRGGKRIVVSNIVEMSENRMNGGASGGGFIADQTVIGVNSFRSGVYMYGPYFDRGLRLLYDGVFSGCPKP